MFVTIEPKTDRPVNSSLMASIVKFSGDNEFSSDVFTSKFYKYELSKEESIKMAIDFFEMLADAEDKEDLSKVSFSMASEDSGPINISSI